MLSAARPGPASLRPSPLDHLHPAVLLGGFIAACAVLVAGNWPMAVGLTLLAAALLTATGWRPIHLAQLMRPWLSVAILVMAIHVLTTTSAAPLGHPSGEGVWRGLVAWVRLAGLFMGLAAIQGALEIDALIVGWSWWLRPLDGWLLPTGDLALVLAVALGTAPRVLDDGRRLQQVVRLRRGGREGRFSWRRIGYRLLVVAPLLEGMARRAETLGLTLRSRSGGTDRPRSPGPLQMVLLLGWVATLAVLTVLAGRVG